MGQQVTKANLECADVILRNNMLYGSAWQGLRHDIAFAITLGEHQTEERIRKQQRPVTQQPDGGEGDG